MILATCHPDRQHKALGQCHVCWRRDYRKRYHATPHGHAVRAKHRKLYAARRYARNPQLVNRQKWLAKYGLTLAAYDAMYAAQGGACAICYIQFPKLDVDHCHRTLKVRELLCNNCNTAIARLNDDPTRMYSAIAYIQRHAPFYGPSCPIDARSPIT